jgi:hypothetical protein
MKKTSGIVVALILISASIPLARGLALPGHAASRGLGSSANQSKTRSLRDSLPRTNTLAGHPDLETGSGEPAGRSAHASSPAVVLGEAVTVKAHGQGRPWVNLGDGHDVLTSYSGEAQLTQQMQDGEARPLSLAAADLDGDGVPDMLSGFAAGRGGIIALYRGNVDAIYPNSRQALARKSSGTFTDAPFLSPARLFEVPSAPDFMETGDFNADGFADVAIASRGSNKLYILPGDGTGGLGAAQALVLPGQVTAMASGDVNRRDGLTDLVVGIAAPEGPKLMVFEGATGTLKSTPEIISLPGEAAAIAVGYLYNNTYADIAVAAGRFLVTVHGRDRRLSLPANIRAAAPAAAVSKLPLPSTPLSIAIGRFNGDQSSQAAVLMDDGRVGVAGADGQSGKLQVLVLASMASGGAGAGSCVMRARLSGRAGDDLVLMDQAANSLRIMVGGAGTAAGDNIPADIDPINLSMDAMPIAVLPMRLNPGGRADLVALRKGHAEASLVPAQFDTVFTVTSTADDPASVNAASQPSSTTLRDTLNEAVNAAPGTSNEIVFNIPQSGVPIINLQADLPPLPADSSLIIDGTTEAQIGGIPSVAINGGGNNVFVVPGSSNVIRGLVINDSAAPVQLTQGNNNTVEGNYIGTQADGVTPSPNSGSGVLISGGSGNTVGGSAPAASNVIGASGMDGITITNNAISSVIAGNFIGTDLTRAFNIANNANGVQVEEGASGTALGSPSAPNYIDLNELDGVVFSSGTNHLIQGNEVQGNRGNGITISASSSTIGGSEDASLGNGLWGNTQNGLLIEPAATGIQVQGNGIGIAFSGPSPEQVGNRSDGVAIAGQSNLIGGAEPSLGNAIAFNGGDGVTVFSGTGNTILSNVIAASSPGIPIHLFPGSNDGIGTAVISSATVTNGSASAGTDFAGSGTDSVGAASAAAIVINFTFKSLPNQVVDLQFYVPQICDCTDCFTTVGIYFVQVTTDAEGNAPSPVTIVLNSVPAPGSYINATATDAGASTSEFSECVQVGSLSACEYQLPSATEKIGSSGGTGSFTVSTSATCSYSASDADSWVHITSGAGMGTGTVTFTVDPNTGSSSRQSSISIVPGVNFTVIQGAQSSK